MRNLSCAVNVRRRGRSKNSGDAAAGAGTIVGLRPSSLSAPAAARVLLSLILGITTGCLSYAPRVNSRQVFVSSSLARRVVLEAQPPAQPHCCVVVERPIRLVDGSYLEVVRPSAQRAVQLCHQLCGLLPCPRSVGQRMDFLDHALDALL